MELRQNKKGTEDPSPPPPGPECRRTKPPRRSLMCLLLLTLLPFPRFPLYFLLPNGKVATWPPPQTSADFFFVFFFLVSFLFRFQLAASASIGTPRPSKRQEPSVSWRDPPPSRSTGLPLRSPWSAAVPHAERDKTKDDDAAAAASEPRGN